MGAKDIPHEDLDYISDANAAILASTPKGGRIMLLATAAFFTIILIWAGVAEIDEVTKGEGKVIPSSQVQIVQNLEGGILSEIMIKEGELVAKNQIMLRIDDTRFSSSLRESRMQYLSLLARAARLQAEADHKDSFDTPAAVLTEAPHIGIQEHDLLKSKHSELQATLNILRQQVDQRSLEVGELEAKEKQLARSLALAEKELEISRPLIAKGAISEIQVLRLERQVADLQGELDTLQIAIPRARSAMSEAQQKVTESQLKFRNQARKEYNEIRAELDQLDASSVALEDRVQRTAVRSPVRGTVKQLLVNTVGGVIQPGAELVQIVPLEDTLLIETKIRPQDIAFLRPGQEATIKFTAYDFAIYGGLKAAVEHISADTIADEKGDSFYLVRLRTDRNYLGSEADPLPIIPGMVAEVDVLTGKKTI
ncbi:MAG: HlyD family type I secretion periplasmic adaptor subunit, partial [Gammaproteobacteria bacterium]|nr:HlyD family type I secretion periplasmic adaptor subunit [Gammaproteobacteria bacterium]